jgi:hypothetical protein
MPQRIGNEENFARDIGRGLAATVSVIKQRRIYEHFDWNASALRMFRIERWIQNRGSHVLYQCGCEFFVLCVWPYNYGP